MFDHKLIFCQCNYNVYDLRQVKFDPKTKIISGKWKSTIFTTVFKRSLICNELHASPFSDFHFFKIYVLNIYFFFLLIPGMYIRPGLYWLNADEIKNRLFKILVKENNCHGDAILISSKLNLWDLLSSSFFQYSKHNLKYTKHKQKINFKFFFISFLVSNLKNGANIFTALIDFDGSYLKNCSSPLNIN